MATATAGDEAVDLDLNAMTASLQVAKANFTHITFREMPETYTVGCDVVCNYVIGSALEASSRDWVGLYKVGWRTPDQYVCYVWSPLPANYAPGKVYENQVVFPASKLPKEDGEFYQFCYVTSSNQVRGASAPFQFRKTVSFSSLLDDLVEVEDENGELLIVKSKSAYLDEQLKKANEKCNILKQDIKILESEKEMLMLSKEDAETRLRRQKEEDASLRQQLSESMSLAENLTGEIVGLKATVVMLEAKISTTVQEKSELQSRLLETERHLSELTESQKVLRSEQDTMIGKLRTLEQEKSLYQSHYSTSESTLQSHVAQNKELVAQLGAEQAKTAQLTENAALLRKQIDEKTQELDACIMHKQETETALAEKLSQADNEIMSRGQQIEALNAELNAAMETCRKISTDLEVARTEAEGLKVELQNVKVSHAAQTERNSQQLEEISQKLAAEIQEKESLSTEITKLHSQLDELAGLAGTDSALYALQAACSSLKEKIFRSDRTIAKQKVLLEQALSQKQELEQELSDQRGEIKSLKERLAMGVEVHKEHFIECQQLREQLRKLENARDGKPTTEDSISVDRLHRSDSVSVIAELQQQMKDFTVELERRSDLIENLETQLDAERRARIAAETRADELASKLPSIHSDGQTFTLPEPLVPQRIYPDVAPEGRQPDVLEQGGEAEMILTVDLGAMSLEEVDGAMDGAADIEILRPVDRSPPSIGEVLESCPVPECSRVFPADWSSLQRATHIDNHFAPPPPDEEREVIGLGVCPICRMQLQHASQLQEHVDRVHFREQE